jgi:hypothetical protein
MINGGFESEVREKLDRQTHTFDCTLNANTPRKKPDDDGVHFYPYCVTGDMNPVEPTKYQNCYGLWNATQITTLPKLLKMDVEGFEFDVLTSMLSNSHPTLWPEQIMMEVHYATRMKDIEWLLRTRSSNVL